MRNLFIRTVQIFIVGLSCIFAMSAFAQTANATDQLTTLLNNFHSMQAQFQQTIIDTQGNAIQQSSGSMALQRPGKFRWETVQPAPQLALADGKFIWVYDQQLQQVTRQRQQSSANNSPAALLSGSVTRLSQQFNTAAIPPITNTDSGFILTPRDKDASFQAVRLYFSHGQLRVMRLIDNLDQTTVIQFLRVRNNGAINPALFHFSPPAGTDVVGQ